MVQGRWTPWERGWPAPARPLCPGPPGRTPPADPRRGAIHLHPVALRGLTVRYPGGRSAALDGVSLTLTAGLCGLLGPNGAGKTTLLRVLATTWPDFDGDVRLAGFTLPAQARQARACIGYVPQQFGLFPSLTCRQCLDYIALLKGITDQAQRRREVDEALELVNLVPERRRRVRTLSGGMQRRLGIAQALLNSPAVLLLDEPTVGLDPDERSRLLAIISELSTERVVLLSTHVVSDVEALCSSIVVLRSGHTVFKGPPGELAAAASGCVWECLLTDDEVARQRALGTITHSRPVNGRLLHHLLSARAPAPAARAAEATLEDGYLWLIRHGSGHD